MTEVIVFLIVGGVAILSAAFMLLSENAVHSALFLVLNFMCVAFFFLTLGAPFIALTQVAVYAGAIMVLFLFVIMLLGAERIPPSPGRLPWLPRAALVLALVFVITAGVAIGNGQIDLQTPLPAAPYLRFIHAADDPTPVDVYLNNQLTLEGVAARQTTDYVTLPAGEYGITVFPAGADPATTPASILGDLTLEPGDVVTLIALGANGAFQLVPLAEDPAPVPDDQARLTVFNAMPDIEAVDLVDPVAGLNPDDDVTLLGGVPYGQPVESILLEAEEAQTFEVRLSPDAAGEGGGQVLVTYRDLDLEANTNTLLLVAPQRLTDGNTRAVPLHLAEQAMPLYGSPAHVAQRLFSTYLLPFELVSIVLLVAMVGAVVLTRDELLRERRRRLIVRRPLVGPQAAGPQAAPDLEAAGEASVAETSAD